MTTKTDNALDIISQTLGAATSVVPIPRPTVEPSKELTETPEAPEIEDDYQEARQNLKELIAQAMESVPELVELARQTQNEKMYTALATFLTTAGNLNISMSKLSKEIKQPPRVKGGSVPEGETAVQHVTNNNNVFVGSTEDFLDMLEARRKDKDEGSKVIDGDCIEVET